MHKAVIKEIEYYLPARQLTNQELADAFPEWSMDKVEQKTGIIKRHIADEQEYVSDMAVAAAKKLFANGCCQPETIDFLLVCTQCPDYLLPTTACLIQDQLALPNTVGALDINLGCSGYVYALSLAKGLLETGQAHNVLLITADTYSKFIRPDDKTVRTLFGDAATATWLSLTAMEKASITSEKPVGFQAFVFGTDGSGAENLMVPRSGMGMHGKSDSASPFLQMKGTEIFNFTLQVIPRAVTELLEKTHTALNEVDLFVFHQANAYILKHLQKKLNIADEKFFIDMRDLGNTVSSTIPIALKNALIQNKLKTGQLIMLLGFGVGYSWAGTLLNWN